MPAQNAPPPAQTSTANIEVSGLLNKIDQTSQSASADLSRMRIDKWKADSGDRQQAQANADSITRNVSEALPGMVSAVRTNPQDFAAAFKLYRNLNALYDVMKTLTEASAAFNAKQDYQTLAPYTDSIDGYRRSLADYMESLAASKDAELVRLRTQAKAQAAAPPKKTIIDDNEPAAKKTSKKKTTKPANTNPQ